MTTATAAPAVPAASPVLRPRASAGSLAEVIEVILDRGMVIDAFVRVSVIGIPVLTVEARVVIASVDNYLRFAENAIRLGLPGFVASNSALGPLAETLGGITKSLPAAGALTGALPGASALTGVAGALPGAGALMGAVPGVAGAVPGVGVPSVGEVGAQSVGGVPAGGAAPATSTEARGSAQGGGSQGTGKTSGR